MIFDRAVTPTADPNGVGAAVAEVVARAWLRPVYQPIMELRTGVMLGVEGLIRPISPAPFADPSSLFEAAADQRPPAVAGAGLRRDDRGRRRRPGARAVPVDQPVTRHAGGARVQHRRAAEHPGAPQLPAGAPGDRADRAAAGDRHREDPAQARDLPRRGHASRGRRRRLRQRRPAPAGRAELRHHQGRPDPGAAQRLERRLQRRGRVGRVAGRPHRRDGGGRGDRASRAAGAARPAGHHRRPGLPAGPARIAPRAGGADRRPRRAVDRRGGGGRRTPAMSAWRQSIGLPVA